LSVLAGTAEGGVFSQLGTVEFRWRERGLGVLPVVGGAQTTSLLPGTAPIAAGSLDAVSNPNLTTDARLSLILEARVIRGSGNSDMLGFAGVGFGMASSDTRAQGRFASSLSNIGSESKMLNASLATTTVATSVIGGDPGMTLPAGATSLPGTSGNADRGVFGPFRNAADLGQKNGPAIGEQNVGDGVFPINVSNHPTLANIVVAGDSSPFTATDPDTGNPLPYFGRYEYAGLNNWVPLMALTYNIAETSTARSITLSPYIFGSTGVGDSGVRGFRGVANPLTGLDLWNIDTAGIPAFVVNIVPAPSMGAMVVLGGSFVFRRRR
jgi:hypothetical protein